MTSRLQAARADRGWSQTQLIAALVARAREQGVALPGLTSLKAMVSRWENGKTKPDALYARLLRELYGLGDSDLGFNGRAADVPAVETANDELVRLLDAAKAATPDAVTVLQQQTDSFRILDRSLGAPALLEQMRGHVGMLSALLRDGVTAAQRQPIAAVLADAAALAGWQALDVGAAAQAWQHFETAKAAAREAGDPGLLAHATAEQAYVLMDLDRPGDAADLIAEARRPAKRLPSLTSCWLSAAEGEAHAHLGDELRALRAFDTAHRLLGSGTADGAPYVVVDEGHLLRWRGNVLARLGHQEAFDCLTAALGAMDASFRRAASSLHCDLALSSLARGDRDTAAVHATTFRSLARQVGSVRQLKRLERVHPVV